MGERLIEAGQRLLFNLGIIRVEPTEADKIDKANAFKPDSKQDNIRPEKIIQWLRTHIQPPPTVDVYRVLEEPNDPQSPWYLIIKIPQGQQAYMAKDHRFYKRVGSTVQPMEQYEVVDVMNRTRAAALDLRIQMHQFHPSNKMWGGLRLNIAVTSTNFVSSEYGALKLILAYPLKFSAGMSMTFRGSHFESSTGLFLGGEDIPHASSVLARWGAHSGNVVFPGDWYNFYGNGFSIEMPKLSVIPNPTYLLQIELFTMNSQSKKVLYSIRQKPSGDSFEILGLNASNADSLIASFWETYHTARGRLKQ